MNNDEKGRLDRIADALEEGGDAAEMLDPEVAAEFHAAGRRLRRFTRNVRAAVSTGRELVEQGRETAERIGPSLGRIFGGFTLDRPLEKK